MLGKTCEYCERTFSKNQQLIRHRRSHTGEQPFRCVVCGKRFGRRDVLVRHSRCHDPNPGFSAKKGQARRAIEFSNGESGNKATPANADTRGPHTFDTDSSLTSLSQQLGSSGGLSLSTSELSTAISVNETCQEESQTQGTTKGTDGVSIYTRTLASDDELASSNGGSATIGTNICSSDYQTSLSAECSSQEETRSSVDFEALLYHLNSPGGLWSVYPDPLHIPVEASGGTSDRDRASVCASSISDASQRRSATAQHPWPTRPPRVPRLARTLRKDVIFSGDGNLFSRIYKSTISTGPNMTALSGSDLKEESRKQLRLLAKRIIPHSCPNESVQNVHSKVSNSDSPCPGVADPPGKRCSCEDSSGLLDLGLDLYIRMFQPLMPILHVPTFKPEEVPTLFLFLMCLLGLGFVNTEEAMEFVQTALPGVLEAVCSDISSNPLENSNSVEIIRLFATSVHMMCLIIMTGGTRSPEQCRILHVQTLTAAQQHGLFTAQCAKALDESLLERIPDADERWKAWSRIESTKRIVVGLILGDAWFSEFFSSGPIIRTEQINILLPCDRKLFQAANAGDWIQLMNTGRETPFDSLVSSLGENRLPVLQSPIDPYAMYGVLFLIQLDISDKFSSLVSSAEPSEVLQHKCIPWKMYAMQRNTRSATSLAVRAIEIYGRVLQEMSPHCIVIWHHAVIKLTADGHILECAAGREGIDRANQALEAIKVWSQTPSARRSCLHAAQIFKALSSRRPRDTTSFQSIPSLFLAALVLAFYLLTSPSQLRCQDMLDTFELIGDINWSEVGNEGLAEAHPGSGATSDNAAINFIRFGGLVSINGVIYSGGVQHAQRILLEFAGLLDDIPKFKIGEHLRIIYWIINHLAEIELAGYTNLRDDAAALASIE